MNPTHVIKRSLAVLALTGGGAALALTPGLAHADEAPAQGTPIVERAADIVDHPGTAVKDTKTALEVTGSAVGTSTKATNSSLAGAGTALAGGLPRAPKATG
jgi:hypothetical protein